MPVSALPLSEMGRCTGRFYLDERYPLIVMRCFFDGSEGQDDNGSQWLTLAGYIASDKFWGQFQPTWEKMLRDRYPVAPYLHMWQMLSHEDPFERANGWTDDKINRFVSDALDLLQHEDKQRFLACAYSVDVTAHSRLVAEGYEIADPATVCAHSCLKVLCDWYTARYGCELIYVFYDRGERFFDETRKEWLRHRDPSKKIVSGENIWGWIVDMHDIEMQNTPPVQAADLVAWGYSRELVPVDRQYRYLGEVIRHAIPISSYQMDEDAMRRIYGKPPAPRLP